MKSSLFFAALVVIILVIGFVIVEAAPGVHGVKILSNQEGLFFWSQSARRYLRISTVVEAMQTNHNSLFRRLHELEIRVKVLERN